MKSREGYLEVIELDISNINDNSFGSFKDVVELMFTKDRDFFDLIIGFIKSSSDTILDDLEVESLAVLFLPSAFVNSYYKWYRKNIDRITIPKFRESLFEAIANKLEEKGLYYHIQLENQSSRAFTNVVDINRVISIKNLRKKLSIKKDNRKAHLYLFKDIRVATDRSRKELSLSLNGKKASIYEGELLIFTKSDFFSLNPRGDITVKVSYEDNLLFFEIEDVQKIESSSKFLNENYFLDDSFEYFDIKDSLIDSIKLTIYDLERKQDTLILERPKKESGLDNSNQEVDNRDISTGKTYVNNTRSIESDVYFGGINGSFSSDNDRFLLNLERFNIPLNGLRELRLHLIEKDGRNIVVGGSSLDNSCEAILKIVYDIENSSFSLMALSDNISFVKREKEAEYQKIYTNKEKVSSIDTDSDEMKEYLQGSEVKIVEVLNGEIKTFNNLDKLIFQDSYIEVDKNRLSIRYIDYDIVRFNDKVEFNRTVSQVCEGGNIIDAKEDLEIGGRVYLNGKTKILGSLLSRNPLIIEDKEDSFKITNSIKSSFEIEIKSSKDSYTLEYGESKVIDKRELLMENHFMLNVDSFTIVSFSIVEN